MKRITTLLVLLFTLSIAGATGITPVTADSDNGKHCPAGYIQKIDDPIQDTVLPKGTVFCVKGGLVEDPQKHVSDGVTPIGDPKYLGKYDVSYVAVYYKPPPIPCINCDPKGPDNEVWAVIKICGDPRALFNIHNIGDEDQWVTIRFVSARTKQAVVKRILVPAGESRFLKRWVQGKTRVTVRWAGEIIASKWVNRKNNIGSCPR